MSWLENFLFGSLKYRKHLYDVLCPNHKFSTWLKCSEYIKLHDKSECKELDNICVLQIIFIILFYWDKLKMSNFLFCWLLGELVKTCVFTTKNWTNIISTIQHSMIQRYRCWITRFADIWSALVKYFKMMTLLKNLQNFLYLVNLISLHGIHKVKMCCIKAVLQ